MSLKKLIPFLAVLALLASMLSCGGTATEAPEPAREEPAPAEEEEPAGEIPEPAEEEEPAAEEPEPAEEDPLPSLPGFDGLLSFGQGGAQDGFCQDWGDSTSCYFPDFPNLEGGYSDWSGSTNPSEIWAAHPGDGDWITLASQSSPLNVVGTGFPANSPVFILLFADRRDSSFQLPDPNLADADYSLVDGWVVRADASGYIDTSINARWENEKKYLLLGATDPDGAIRLRASWDLEADPWDVFRVRLEGSAAAPKIILEMGIAGSDDHVYVWYRDGSVSSGTSADLDQYRASYGYSLAPGKTPDDIVGMGIAGSDDHVYVWYQDGTVSSGTSADLDQYRTPYSYSLAPGKTPYDIVGMGIAGSDDHVYVWYQDGTFSSGTSADLDQFRPTYSYSLPPDKTNYDIAGMGIAGSDDHVYVWYKDGTVSSGSSADLDQYRAPYNYSLE